MKKRGQFYIIAAVIIVGVLIGIFAVNNYVKTNNENEKFYDLTEELNLESGRVIDYGIYNQKNIRDLLNNFTGSYLNYSMSKINAGRWIFVYGDEEELTAVAYSKVDTGSIGIIIGGQTTDITIQETRRKTDITPQIVSGGKKMTIKAFGIDYEFELEEGKSFYFLIGSGGEYVSRN